jgi:hypothetical protein
VAGELAVAVAGRVEPYRLAVNATVVNATVELVDPGSSTAITEVKSKTCCWQWRSSSKAAAGQLGLKFCIQLDNSAAAIALAAAACATT